MPGIRIQHSVKAAAAITASSEVNRDNRPEADDAIILGSEGDAGLMNITIIQRIAYGCSILLRTEMEYRRVSCHPPRRTTASRTDIA